jgi:class 3 adenylate cyclase
VVKTIGDAVMASFNSPADAVSAALDMLREIEAFNQAHGSREILLKVGVHRGPSIAVTLNERLDYFGQSVNIAARVQGLAEAEEICVTEAVWKAPGVQEQFKDLEVDAEDASLKGISSKMRIYRVSERLGRPKSKSAAHGKRAGQPKVKAKAETKAKHKAKARTKVQPKAKVKPKAKAMQISKSKKKRG